MAELEHIVQFADDLLGIPAFPDYSTALNGLQVGGPDRVERMAAAVDATEASIAAAREAGADLLVVHHGLFWAGLQPITGPRLRKLAALLQQGIALYSAHLPLDAHPEVGNCALLADRLGVRVTGTFGAYKGVDIGVRGELELDAASLESAFASAVSGPVTLIEGGPSKVRTVAVVTGGGGSFVAEAAAAGIDALITGEASHHSYHDAMELGVNLLLGGHYATETFGVKALCERISDRFGVAWSFLDLPTGL